MARRKTAAAFASWIAFHDIKRRRKENLQRAVGRMRNRRRTLAWNSWLDWIDSKRRKQLRLIKAVRHWQLQSASKSWNSWQAYMQERRKHRRILKHWTSRHMSKAWRRWVELVYTRRRHRLILSRSVARMRRKGMVEAWDAWLGAIDDRCHAELCAHRDALDEEAQSLRAENERLRRDNERFVRLIDSGEWGRGRVAELVQAGEVMKGERDALMKLIGSLRREYEAVQEAKLAQESELAEIKKRITGGGGAGRNRLLVKGGSSFNGLVRAMKAEMAQAAETGKPVDPNRIYEIDRLSMDHVQVYPDGELSVQGFDKDATRTGRFSRPLPVGQHRRTRMLPSPQPQHYSMSSKSPGPSPLSSSRQTQASPEGQPWSRITRALDSRIARNRKLGNSDASSNQ
uniref:Centriole proteome protein n=1 Tax=Tetraselmis sp. GSL018 TaxID=582737 RepID=A0A061RCM8_9CHLO